MADKIKMIGIDCDPWQARPDTYIGGVIKDLGFEDQLTNPASKSFGAWVYEFNVSDEDWNKVVGTIKSRLEALYANDQIRGARNTSKIS